MLATSCVRFGLCLLLCAGVSHAGDSPQGKEVSFSGKFARDGSKLIFWISKQRQFVIEPAPTASDELKKQLHLDNIDALSKPKWIVKGRSQDRSGVLVLVVDSMAEDPNAGKPKKEKTD